MTSLFISYSRLDKEIARKLTENLKEQDFDYWIDWEGIPPTVDWWKEIQTGIEQAGVFLFLLSPDSCKSKVCRDEIKHACNNGKRLIPIVVRDIKSDEAPAELSPLNWIFLRESDNFTAGLKKLITAIQTNYDWVQTHRDLQNKALDWERNGRKNAHLLHGEELQAMEFELKKNKSKEPHLTDLQGNFVFKSRQVTDGERKFRTRIAMAVISVIAILGMYGWVQAGRATANAATAQTQQAIAQAQSTQAYNNAQTAIANEREAKEQARIALARQLAAQSQSLSLLPNPRAQIRSGYLAIQSMKLVASSEAAEVLLKGAVARHSVILLEHHGPVYRVEFSPNGKYIATVSCEIVDTTENDPCTKRSVTVWEAMTGREIAQMDQSSTNRSVVFSQDSSHVLSVGCDKVDAQENFCVQESIRVWGATTGKEIAHFPVGGEVLPTPFSPDARYIVTASDDFTLHVWETSTGKEVSSMPHHDYVLSANFSLNAKYVVTGASDDTVTVWETLTGKEVASKLYDELEFATISPDGQYVVSKGPMNTRVWEILTGKEVANLSHSFSETSVVFSPNGKYLALGGLSTVYVWDSLTGKELTHMLHSTDVIAIAFSPDSKYIVTSGMDNTARVWEANTGKAVAGINHHDVVPSVAFSPDGKYVLSASRDQTARLWLWRPDDLIERACADLAPAPNLSPREWQIFVGDILPYQAICPNNPIQSEMILTPTGAGTP